MSLFSPITVDIRKVHSSLERKQFIGVRRHVPPDRGRIRNSRKNT